MSIANPYLYGHNPANIRKTKLKRRAAIASLSVAVILIGAKFGAFLLTNSVSLLSSLMDSTFDALASLVTLISITRAALPADANHRFGHGKIEALGALAQAAFIGASSIFLFAESARRFVSPQEIEDPFLGIGVMVFSVLLTAALISYQRSVIRKTGSVSIRADYLHYTGDIVMNISVLLALALGYVTGWHYFDPIFAVGIAIRLLWGTWSIGTEAFDILLDKELPDEGRARIISIVTANPAIRGLHDLRTRNTGDRHFISMHVEVSADLSMAAVHDVMDELEDVLFKAFPKAEVLIHPEPEGLEDHRLDHQIKN